MMKTLFGEEILDTDTLARSIIRKRHGPFKITHKYGTNRGLSLQNSDGLECVVAGKPGFYALHGPRIAGKNILDFNDRICYYVGYSGSNNTIRNRLSRFVAQMMGNNTINETHPSAERLKYIAGADFCRHLSVYVMPYDITEWELLSTYSDEREAWHDLERSVIGYSEPFLNMKR